MVRRLRARLGIAADAPLLVVLPGSRTNEIRLLLPPFREAVALLKDKIPDLVCVLPTVHHVAARVRERTKDWPTPLHILEGDDDNFAAFDAADAALAASGTVTTELALSARRWWWPTKRAGSPINLMRPLVDVKFATLVNIILDREAVPEFIQDKCKPAALADALYKLLRDPVRARATDERSRASRA